MGSFIMYNTGVHFPGHFILNVTIVIVIIAAEMGVIMLQKRREKKNLKIEYLNLVTFNCFAGLPPLILYLLPDLLGIDLKNSAH